MITKPRLTLPLLVTGLVISASFAPKCFGFGEFERGSLLLNTQASATYDSYFIGSKDPGSDDYYFSLHPELRYTRNAGLAEISGFVGVDVLRYDTNTQYDGENLSGQFRVQLPTEGTRLSGNVLLGYQEATVIDYDVLSRIREKTATASVNLKYQLGLKTSLAENLGYTYIFRNHFSDQSLLDNQLSFLYSDFLDETTLRITEGFDRTTSSGENALNTDLDQTSNSLSVGLSRPLYGPVIGEASLGYRILDRSAQENYKGQTRLSGVFYSLTLHGPFLPPSEFPKIESSASITYEESQAPGINDTGEKTLTGNISLSWQARPRTKVSLSADRVVGLSATDLSVDTSQVRFAVDENLGYDTTVYVQTSYIWRTYPGSNRHDNTWDSSISVTHHFNKYWSAGATYEYQDNTGDPATNLALANFDAFAFDFSRNVFSVFVTNIF